MRRDVAKKQQEMQRLVALDCGKSRLETAKATLVKNASHQSAKRHQKMPSFAAPIAYYFVGRFRLMNASNLL